MRRLHTGWVACSIAATACASACPSAWAQDTPDPPAASPGTPAGPGLRWHVPLALSGSLGYELRLDHAQSERARVHQMLTATLQAASYIYQPWLAVVNGQLGLTLSRGRGGEHDGMDRDQFVTGSLRLGLFPRSRFPFEGRYEVSDSRIDPALGGGIAYRARTLTLTQRYRPAGGDFDLMASYERRAQDGEAIGEDTQEALLANFSARWRRQDFNAALSRTLSRRRATDEQAEVRGLVLRHATGLGGELSVESSVNWNQTVDDLQSGRFDQRVAQWNSLAVWRPAERPYALSASVRGFRFTGSEFEDIESVSAALSGHYELGPQLRLTAGATVNHNRGSGGDGWVGTLGATWQGDTRRWADWSHNWFGGAAASRAHQSAADEDTLSAQLGQSVSRVWGPSGGSTWSLAASQTASASHTRGRAPASPLDDPDSRALAHTVGLGWNHAAESGTASMRLSLSDARQFSGDRAHLQLINFQLNGAHEIDRQRRWSGNLTVQRMFQRARDLADPLLAPSTVFDFDRQITHSASGELGYQQVPVFNVPRLRFSSTLRISADAQHQRDTLVALPDRETASWENRLDWRVGRLDAYAALRASRTDGLWRSTLTLRVLRNFGD